MSSDLPLVVVFVFLFQGRTQIEVIVLPATSVMMGVELLKFIAVLFLELHFAYVQEASKRHQGKLIEQLSNCDRKSTLKKTVLFAKIYTYFHNRS